jgi:hypothetical protein
VDIRAGAAKNASTFPAAAARITSVALLEKDRNNSGVIFLEKSVLDRIADNTDPLSLQRNHRRRSRSRHPGVKADIQGVDRFGKTHPLAAFIGFEQPGMNVRFSIPEVF